MKREGVAWEGMQEERKGKLKEGRQESWVEGFTFPIFSAVHAVNKERNFRRLYGRFER